MYAPTSPPRWEADTVGRPARRAGEEAIIVTADGPNKGGQPSWLVPRRLVRLDGTEGFVGLGATVLDFGGLDRRPAHARRPDHHQRSRNRAADRCTHRGTRQEPIQTPDLEPRFRYRMGAG